jgi:hypothetical protein
MVLRPAAEQPPTMISNSQAEVSEWFGMVKAALGGARAAPPAATSMGYRTGIKPRVGKDRLTVALAMTYCKR